MLSPRASSAAAGHWWVVKPSTWFFLSRDPLLPISTRQLHRVHAITHLLDQGVNIPVLQETTAIYLTVATKVLRTLTIPLDLLTLRPQSLVNSTHSGDLNIAAEVPRLADGIAAPGGQVINSIG